MKFMSKIKDFTITYASWAAAGFPRRNPEWVVELFAICEPCDKYDKDGVGPFGDVGLCKACGCHVGPDVDNIRNKLVLPNTSCPIGKWSSSIGKKEKTKSKVKARVLKQQKEWRKQNKK